MRSEMSRNHSAPCGFMVLAIVVAFLGARPLLAESESVELGPRSILAQEARVSFITRMNQMATSLKNASNRLSGAHDPEAWSRVLHDQLIPALETGADMLLGAWTVLTQARVILSAETARLDRESRVGGFDTDMEVGTRRHRLSEELVSIDEIRTRLGKVVAALDGAIQVMLYQLKKARVLSSSRNISEHVATLATLNLDSVEQAIGSLLSVLRGRDEDRPAGESSLTQGPPNE